MKKIIFGVFVLSLLCCGCDKKKFMDQAEEPMTAQEGSQAVKVDVSDFDRYEGKIVEASTGQWFLIKEGSRWRTNSVKSSDDYLKKLPVGPDYVVKGVPIQTLQQFPEVGELLPNLEFKKDEKPNIKP